MSDKKKCPFCEAIALQRFIEEHHSKPAGFGMALSAALVSYAVVNGRKCGRTTDYMKDGKGKPEGIPTELADVIIRVLDYCGYAGIDIDAAISQKHEYNKSRPYRHGGKKC